MAFSNRRTGLLSVPLSVRLVLAMLLPILAVVPARADEALGTPTSSAPATPASATPGPSTAAGEPVVWTQIGVDGELIARAVVPGDCPSLTLDGADVPMAARSGPTGDVFADTVCEAEIPSGVDRASIGAKHLALLSDDLTHLTVLGDMGCRVSRWDPLQDCDDPAGWPLRSIAANVAAARPHLILHVGDYIYRESPCPPGEAACAGSPWGDNQATWQADVFDPLAELLPAAPWIFLRGNHESCSREGIGWFRYFDPRPMPSACERFTEPYALDLPGLPRLVVMDTAEAGDTRTSDELNETFTRQLAEVAALSRPGSWLLTHKPVSGGILELDGREQVVTNATFESIVGSRLPESIALVVSGHIHLAEALVFEPAAGRPPQLIAGHSGTRLDRGVNGAYDGALLDDPALRLGLVAADFGWMTIEPGPDRITAAALDVEGRPLFVIHLGRK